VSLPSHATEERFWENVQLVGDCLIWTGYMAQQRPRFGDTTARHWAWEHWMGPVDEVLNTCGKNRCVSIEHLSPKTHPTR
jgi:hypothetical protein